LKEEPLAKGQGHLMGADHKRLSVG